jgi:transposase
MKHYSLERKESALHKMMPPSNMSIAKLSLDMGMGMGESTLYNWRKQAMNKGQLVPGDERNTELWSSANKFAVVLETASLNKAELALYCRNKGLYAEQITTWRSACVDANANVKEHEKEHEKAFNLETKKDKNQISSLEKKLRRKEKALAEKAALLVLRKKANAIWGEAEDE